MVFLTGGRQVYVDRPTTSPFVLQGPPIQAWSEAPPKVTAEVTGFTGFGKLYQQATQASFSSTYGIAKPASGQRMVGSFSGTFGTALLWDPDDIQ